MLKSVMSSTENLPTIVQFKTVSDKTEHLHKIVGFDSAEYEIFQNSRPSFSIVVCLISSHKQMLSVARSPLLSSIPLVSDIP